MEHLLADTIEEASRQVSAMVKESKRVSVVFPFPLSSVVGNGPRMFAGVV